MPDRFCVQHLRRLAGNQQKGRSPRRRISALAESIDPKLVQKTLAIALTDELPTSRAIFSGPGRRTRQRSPGYCLGVRESESENAARQDRCRWCKPLRA